MEELEQGTVMYAHFPMGVDDVNGDVRKFNAGLYIFDHMEEDKAVFVCPEASFVKFYSKFDMNWEIYYLTKPTGESSQIRVLSYELKTLIEVKETGELLDWDWHKIPHIQYPNQ